MQDRFIYTLLAAAGALPFVAGAFLLAAGVDDIASLGPVADLVLAYGLAIVSFLAGVHWATDIYHRPRLPMSLAVGSNVVVIAAWLAFALSTQTAAFVTQIVAFGYLLAIDRRLEAGRLISTQYYRMRAGVTLVVVVSLAVAAFSA